MAFSRDVTPTDVDDGSLDSYGCNRVRKHHNVIILPLFGGCLGMCWGCLGTSKINLRILLFSVVMPCFMLDSCSDG